MELEALQEIDPEVRGLGGRIVALTPELERYTRSLHKKLNLTFDILTDLHLKIGDRLHPDAEQRVDHELHRRARTAGSEIKVLPRDRVKDRLGGLESLFVAAAEERQRSLFGGRSAAGEL